MIDHMTIRVSDIEKTKLFYSKALEPVGYKLNFDRSFGDTHVIGFAKGGKIDTWFTSDKPVSGPMHIAWRVNSKEEVDAFYEKAISAGGKDNGKPGFREIYHANYYGAYVFDPDGNNIEAVFHNYKEN